MSSSAERARGRRRGPRPGLAPGGNPSPGRLDAPPRPPAAIRPLAQGECPRHRSSPRPAPGLRSPVCSPEAPASPGPGPLRQLRRAVGPGHSPASRAVHRLRPEEKEGRARRESPAYTSAAGANQRPLRQAAAPPMGDAPANQEERLADRANRKLPECASRGKRTEPELPARRRGRGRDPRPDGQQV